VESTNRFSAIAVERLVHFPFGAWIEERQAITLLDVSDSFDTPLFIVW
jgi:hypothetical protein